MIVQPERIVFFGRNVDYPISHAALLELISALTGKPHEIVSVITTCDVSLPHKLSLQSIAQKNGLNTRHFLENDVNSNEAASYLRSVKPTLFLVVQFPKIFSKDLLNISSKEALNVHRGWPLRGGSIDLRAILNGNRQYSVVLHRIEEGIDTGNILAEETFPLCPQTETGVSLDSKVTEAGKRLIRKGLLPLLGQDFPQGHRQDLAQTQYENKWSSEKKRVRPASLSFEQAERLSRALNHPREKGLELDLGHEIVQWWSSGSSPGLPELRQIEWLDGPRIVAVVASASPSSRPLITRLERC